MGLKLHTGGIPVITNPKEILWFGRYKNLTVADVLLEDPAYLSWAQWNVDGFDLHYSLLEIAEQDTERTRFELMSEYHWR